MLGSRVILFKGDFWNSWFIFLLSFLGNNGGLPTTSTSAGTTLRAFASDWAM